MAVPGFLRIFVKISNHVFLLDFSIILSNISESLYLYFLFNSSNSINSFNSNFSAICLISGIFPLCIKTNSPKVL